MQRTSKGQMDNGAILYAQYLDGDDSSLEQLVRLYSDGLVRFAYCIVNDSAVAEDVAADAFATLIFRRKRFFPRASFKTYLYKIARNKCLDYLRFHRRFVPLDDVSNVIPSDAGDVNEYERNLTLYRCMAQLNAQYRDVLTLTYIEGFSADEAARITGKNIKQIYNLLARAKKESKQLLINEGIDYEDL